MDGSKEHSMTAATLIFYVHLHVKPEHLQAWKVAANEIIEAMSAEDAFISCDMNQDASDETHFTLYERWAEPSVEAFLKNQMKPYRVAYDAKLEYMLQRPREAQVLIPVKAWRAR
jgi:quinol monooxygenase YgiN